MALDPHYITDGPLQEYFVDKDTGLPLSGGIVTFYRDSSRITPKTVYELTGAPPNYTYTPLPNPMILSAVGTFQDGSGNDIVVYYYPWEIDGVTPDLYYITVQDSNGVDQFTREAWPNSAESGGPGPTPSSSLPVQNQISNPQFSQVLINYVPTLSPTTTTFTVTGSNQEFEVAPNWSIVASSSMTDTVVVQRLAIPGSAKAPTNPPYSLVVTTGINITFCTLRQRFYVNSGLWTSTTGSDLFLSAGIVIKNQINVSTTVAMFYKASSGALSTPIQLLSETVPASSDYTYYTGGSTQIPMSDDGLDGTDGYIDIYVKFTPGSSVAITSIQVVPSINTGAAPLLNYDLASSNRDEALMGDYYLPRVTTSPIPSLLTGWDFPLNPAQFEPALAASPTTNQTVSTTASYIWDQTICAISGGTAPVTRDTRTGSISFAPTDNNNAMYMLQYLDAPQAQEIIFSRLSTNISAFLGAGGGNVTVSVYMYSAPSTASFPTLPTSLVSIANNGVISGVAAGWNIIPRSGLDTPRAALSINNPSIANDIQFTGWEITDLSQIADTNKYAMVVTFTWDTATVINVESVSLTKGDLPTRPAPQTPSDVLSECQYYYEKTCDKNVALANISNRNGCVLVQQYWNGGASEINGRSFGIQYKNIKRVAPTLTFYSVDGTVDRVSGIINTPGTGESAINNVDIAKFTQLGPGLSGTYLEYDDDSVLFVGSATGRKEVYILFNYGADARLGVV